MSLIRAGLEANGSAMNGAAASAAVNGEAWIPAAGDLITQLVPPPVKSTAAVDARSFGMHSAILFVWNRPEDMTDCAGGGNGGR